MTKAKKPKQVAANSKLAKYQKGDKQGEMVLRSVNISRTQYEFLNRNSVNLSQLARDAIQDLMDSAEGL